MSETAPRLPGWFMSRVNVARVGCWMWTGAVSGNGYGRYGKLYVHRVAYASVIGPIPDGMDLDHLCRNRWCCNPAHLEAVTRSENLRRGHMDRNSMRTHCKYGHEFTADNTHTLARGQRVCRACARDRSRRSYHSRRAPV